MARVTTLFYFEDRDVELVTGQPILDLSCAYLELFLGLGLVEPLPRDR